MKYRATVTAEFLIEAENVAQAKREAASLTCIGERVGGRRGVNERDWIRHSITRLGQSVRVERVTEGT